MKTSHLFLSLVSLSLTVISARSATNESANDTVELPVFTVTTPRQTEAERQIARNMDELRAAAKVPVAVSTETPLQAASRPAAPEPTKAAPVMIIAKS